MEALRFSKDHFWVRIDGRHARLGLCGHGLVALDGVKAVELPEVGDRIERGEALGELQSHRSVAELLCPVSGTITAINLDLGDSPSLVNDDPHHGGWLVEIDLSDAAELDGLMSSEQYEALVAEEA